MFQDFTARFKNAVLGPAVDSWLRAMGEAGEAEAKRLAPVRTGELRDSISYSYDQQSKTVTLSANAKHSLFLELGTRYISAHPYLRPALGVMAKVKPGLRARIGGGTPTMNVSAPNHPEKYHARAQAYTGGKIGRAHLKLGHGKFR